MADGSESDGREEAGGEAAPVFEATEHGFDEIAA